MGWHYLDTSAFVKLIHQEEESDALREWISSGVDLATSTLTWTEATRAIRRAGGNPALIADVMDTLLVINVDAQLFQAAGNLSPLELRSLDAIHIESAKRLQPDLASIVTYDKRMAAAISLQGIPVISPKNN
jgi:predicted nucleic acid-binding protein